MSRLLPAPDGGEATPPGRRDGPADDSGSRERDPGAPASSAAWAPEVAGAVPSVQVQVTRLHPRARLPVYASELAAGCDLAAALDEPVVLAPGQFRRIPTGLSVALPPGYEAQVRPRSGWAARHGVTVLNAPGTIDADYRGEIQVVLINHGPEPVTIAPGDRIAQLVVAPVCRARWVEVAGLPPSPRGQGGFGSTGRR